MDATRAEVIAAAFALGTPTAPPRFVARGAMGEIWQVVTDGGERWAVKELFDWAEVDDRPRDVDFQTAAAAAGIHLPRPRPAPDGRFVVDRTRVYEWADLGPLMTGPVDDATAGEVGGILGRLHALAMAPAPGEEVDDWYRIATSTEELAALAERGGALGRPWADALHERLPLLADLCDLVATSPMRTDDVIVCHCDLTIDNVFRPATGGPLVVIDWENAGPLSAESELAATLAAWVTPATAAPLLRGYVEAGGTAIIRGPESFAADTATTLNYLRVLAEQSIEDDGHRDFAEPRLIRLLTDTLSQAGPRGWTA